MSSAELELLHELLALNRPRPGMTLEERRALYDRAESAFAAGRPGAGPARTERFGECEGLWVGEQGAAADRPVLLYLHGGSYTMGSPRSHRHLARELAGYCDADAVVLDYRRPPEHPFPAAVEDAVCAYRALATSDARRIVLAGDSAGAGLALAAVQVLREEGEPPPAAVLCFSPWADLECALPSHAALAQRDPLLRTEDLRAMAGLYLGGRDPRDPLASPLFADFDGFPPLLIQVGSEEILLDDARLLAERALAAGAEVDYAEWPGMFHVWQYYHPMLDEGRRALEQAAAFARKHAGPAPSS